MAAVGGVEFDELARLRIAVIGFVLAMSALTPLLGGKRTSRIYEYTPLPPNSAT
jgi:hypothetical protein